jgi:hypothetical protein
MQIFSHDSLSIPASIRDTKILKILFPTHAHKIPRKSPELLTELDYSHLEQPEMHVFVYMYEYTHVHTY